MKKSILILIVLSIVFVTCENHVFDNPVDPGSDTYTGVESVDFDGDGVGSYEDVDEIVIAGPVDGVVITDTASPVLTIQLLNPELITFYRIQISTVSNFASDIVFDSSTLTSNVFAVPTGTLVASTTYYWRAMAFDGSKWSDDWSNSSSFTINFSVPIVSGTSFTYDTTPTWAWTIPMGSTGIQYQLDSENIDSWTVVDGIGTATYNPVSELSEGSHTLYVQAKDNNGNWSSSGSFTIIIVAPTVVVFSGLTANGISGLVTTTSLELTFEIDPISLVIDDITVNGATKETFSGTGTTRTLTISNISVVDGANLTISLMNPLGFSMSPTSKTVTVNIGLAIGDEYQGGKIAYILHSGQSGYEYAIPHGLIVANDDQGINISWSSQTNAWVNGVEAGATSTDYGTGQANTIAIIAQAEGAGNSDLSTYAAGICDEYTNPDTGTGVYSDWYLPSRDELNIIYNNKPYIGGFLATDFWSSSEISYNTAYYHTFYYGFYTSGNKNSLNRVRAVRTF